MTDQLNICLAQLNPIVGDLPGNAEKLLAAAKTAAENGADLVVTSELFLCGYPPEDLVRRPSFLEQIEVAVLALAQATSGGPAILLGTPWRENGRVFNAALLLSGGEIVATRYKVDLPNYGVFDEKRVFDAGDLPGPIEFRGVRLGVMVCEDMWKPDVSECLAETGAEVLIVLNGSPFELDKWEERERLAQNRVRETGLPLLYVNQVGGQDELVFDGRSFALNGDGTGALLMPAWTESVERAALVRQAGGWRFDEGSIQRPGDRLDNVYSAMVLGLRDYVNKNGFPGVLLGMSGGIDSALSAVVAADALGADRVHCVSLPSKYTSRASIEDAAECCARIGCRIDTVSIEPAIAAFDAMLAGLFENRDPDATEENVQARARGVTLMALSNKFGSMVLTTGNKSEMSVGYATLYGDMCGGYSVLKDIYKIMVYDLARWRNANVPIDSLGPIENPIPENIITKAPSAELRPDQTDQDSLPPYEDLDQILLGLVEEERSLAEIVALGHDASTVRRIARLLAVAEYKRRQAPPGVKITRKSFGRDRRYPITNRFTEQV
ncbi:MAG: NAD+ synthase [Proteobacteria bacterium]|nr:NAD+ synthase [Pseudomonadota bacterium]MDA1057146.1 NAD+ synthase [Pseudomonadota bacterium]